MLKRTYELSLHEIPLGSGKQKNPLVATSELIGSNLIKYIFCEAKLVNLLHSIKYKLISRDTWRLNRRAKTSSKDLEC